MAVKAAAALSEKGGHEVPARNYARVSKVVNGHWRQLHWCTLPEQLPEQLSLQWHAHSCYIQKMFSKVLLPSEIDLVHGGNSASSK